MSRSSRVAWKPLDLREEPIGLVSQLDVVVQLFATCSPVPSAFFQVVQVEGTFRSTQYAQQTRK